ncbi:hypothetical protein L249_6273 [Ophiocordyceps polyrhachis-furcata BCC 54312]|uniref:Ketoreductase (KR) domain-containing protein n=1 Tax=Ophiocordyceps polyrhachis-furcata BCC 54312 TaxID=1330021 RepID=A0A367L101_9HYPO|nr:hypothetical protein L249_6273 [Ophiocordyceps polyrhachis-furcata BCC 54312]
MMSLVYRQLMQSMTYPTGSYSGKTIIITGSNTGLGKEAARHYARLGAGRLILAVRSLDKGAAAKADIEAGVANAAIEVWHLDMASYASVRRFAARVESELERLDIFLANAGLARTRLVMAEGNEEMVTVNFISTFLLAALVMPKLKETAGCFGTRPTLTIVASATHGHTQLPQKSAAEAQLLETINQGPSSTSSWAEHYAVSKLLQVMGVRALAERHPSSAVTVNCVNPGLCHSELARDVQGWRFHLFKMAFARSTEAGSRTLVHAAAQGPESHGRYLSECALVEPSAFVRSLEGKRTQDRVWDELVDRLEAIQPGVLPINEKVPARYQNGIRRDGQVQFLVAL